MVDDGSTDGTSQLLAARDDIHRDARTRRNQGYGAALRSAFDFAVRERLRRPGDDRLRRPAPAAVDPQVRRALRRGDVDIVSGSRYLRRFPGDSDPPAERRRINQIITEEVNRRLGLHLTDAFCGFKAYRAAGLGEDRIARNRLRHAAGAVGAGGAIGAANRRTAGAVDLPRREAIVRRGAGRRRDARLAVYREVLDRARCGRRDALPDEQGSVSRLMSSCQVEHDHLRAPTRRSYGAGRTAVRPGSRHRHRECLPSGPALDYDLHGRSSGRRVAACPSGIAGGRAALDGGISQRPAVPADPRGLIYVAGHQPQMFHPGVWFKNFALGDAGRGARRDGGQSRSSTTTCCPTPRSACRAGRSTEPRRRANPVGPSQTRMPYEERRIEDRELFASFGRRVAEQIAPLVADPLDRAVLAAGSSRARMRRTISARAWRRRVISWKAIWGLETLEVPQSRVCAGEAFQWFVAHLLARFPEFRDDPQRGGARISAGPPHPQQFAPGARVGRRGCLAGGPALGLDGGEPRRRRLFARAAGGEIILADRQSWEADCRLRSRRRGRPGGRALVADCSAGACGFAPGHW